MLAAQRAAFSTSAKPAQARRSVVAKANANRPLWLPGSTPPAYLDGTAPGVSGAVSG